MEDHRGGTCGLARRDGVVSPEAEQRRYDVRLLAALAALDGHEQPKVFHQLQQLLPLPLEALLRPQELEERLVERRLERQPLPLPRVFALGDQILVHLVHPKVAEDHRDGVDDPLRVEDDELAQPRQVKPADGADRVEVAQHQLHLALEAEACRAVR